MDKRQLVNLLAQIPDEAKYLYFQHGRLWFSAPKDWKPTWAGCVASQERIGPRKYNRWMVEL